MASPSKRRWKENRSQLKNVFWPNIFVGVSFQILDNQQVACGFKLGPAAILNQNPIFEMASNEKDLYMLSLNEGDILTRITRYNLIRNQRLIYIDVHETKAGRLAGKFVAVPNLINIVARQDFQGTGQTEAEALENCLHKIKDLEIEDLFPKKE